MREIRANTPVLTNFFSLLSLTQTDKMSTPKDMSPYLRVEEKDLQQSGHVANPLMPSTGTSTSVPTQSSPMAAAAEGSESSSKVGCIVKGMMGHGILAVLSFLSFALIGSININVQSGQVEASDLLLTNNCNEEIVVTGKLDFSGFRFLLSVGVLCWIYSCSSCLLGIFKVAVSACLVTKQPRLLILTDKLSIIVAVCDGLFCLLTFLVSFFCSGVREEITFKVLNSTAPTPSSRRRSSSQRHA